MAPHDPQSPYGPAHPPTGAPDTAIGGGATPTGPRAPRGTARTSCRLTAHEGGRADG
ncbi:hypothetical protein [Streptomyces clavuligerus]|uniref:hypothetical protein n=1 Tax=Streptomyces clavuligerus TaxID=1901 RepID=UPI0013C51AA5|nr:hypothetical protein [Streptomyces clavuligerus]QPJ91677.1 hypothetical protein GE265_00860 [Streptomyces clavuligerus]QPL66193.1 hypothetical protein I3J04_27235 [Streptomyces clavuligerus]QPL71702.1 hypothetical protein I3J05_24320 [Streptomyces clavuligerus]QPL78305.1 hypothetical protein I3J06_27250 [Streptomyces clavuligerus]QPL84329.1 hypothetical protein I3J07_27285 [Streptomyces clavuligerus]